MDENTIALVTGAGAGIGRACARALAAAGALAIATDINGAAAAQTVDLILDDAGRPEDIAAAVVFLSSPGSEYVHGQVLADGSPSARMAAWTAPAAPSWREAGES
jgi:NAD(P)-dependent dehydrogenase (short-subunit alcohol dehydrogenase family)